MIEAIFYANPDTYPPIINSTRLLAQAGYRVDILCREYGARWGIQYPTATTVRRLPDASQRTWAAYLGFVKHVWQQARRDATVYIGHDMHGFLPARLLATRLHKPLIYHCHDFTLDSSQLAWGGRLVAAFERRWARTADLVIVPDAERGQVGLQALRLRETPMIVANAPLHAPPPSLRLQESVQAMGKSWRHTVLRQGVVGPGHALEATIQSLPHWHRPDWGLAILGGGDPAYGAYLQQLASDLDVLSQVAFLPAVAYDEVARFTVGADLGHGLYEPTHVNNMYITTASNKLMEYMAAGIPVLVSDRPGLRAMVERYECGLTADESDPVSIAAAVNTLLDDPERARKMGANAARAFEEEFRYDKQFAPVLTAIKEMASRRRS